MAKVIHAFSMETMTIISILGFALMLNSDTIGFRFIGSALANWLSTLI